jgi:hypothetical protein
MEVDPLYNDDLRTVNPLFGFLYLGFTRFMLI